MLQRNKIISRGKAATKASEQIYVISGKHSFQSTPKKMALIKSGPFFTPTAKILPIYHLTII